MKFNWKFWLTFVTFALMTILVVFNWQDIIKAGVILTSGRINIYILAIILPIQLICYFGRGEIVYLYLRSKNENVSRLKMTRRALEISFVDNVAVLNSVAGMAYFSWSLLPDKVSSHNSIMAQISNYALTLTGSVVLMIVSAIVLMNGSGSVALVAIILAVTTMILIIGVGVIIRDQKRIMTFSLWLVGIVNLLHRKFSKKTDSSLINLEIVKNFFDGLRQNFVEITTDKKTLFKQFAWAMIVACLEPALLWLTFASLGFVINPFVAIVAFYLSYALCLLSVTPGGSGSKELGVILLLVSAGGVSSDIAIAGTVLASVVELVIVFALGYYFYQKTINRYGKLTL